MNEKKVDESNSWVVYEKTEKGVEEIQTRKYNLSQKFRSILIVIDGKLTVGALLSEFSGMEQVATVLTELERQGFIEKRADILPPPGADILPPPGADIPPPGGLSSVEEQRRVRMARTFMINTVTDAVGAMGSSLIDNLMKCATLRDLQSHFENYLYTIASGRGKSTAEDYRNELSKLLYP